MILQLSTKSDEIEWAMILVSIETLLQKRSLPNNTDINTINISSPVDLYELLSYSY